ETAQLEFKHRKLNVAQAIEGLSDNIATNIYAAESPEEDAGIVTSGTEQKPGSLYVELTPEDAEIFTSVLSRMQDDFAKFAGQKTILQNPSTLEMSIQGNSSLKYNIFAIQIVRKENSNEFIFPLPPDPEKQTNYSIEETNNIIGENGKIYFSEIIGALDEDIGLTGDDLATSYPGTHASSQQPIVNLVFKERGTAIFAELTQRIAGSPTDQIAIILDDKELLSPVVQSAILSGTTIIEGNFTLQEVKDVSLLLESGRLPLPIELLRERNVDAILGADSLQKSLIAGIIGLGLVILFMFLYYRVPGLIAGVALIIYTSIVLSILKISPGNLTTLNLSGVAALILSIGMAVDANILIFERMKEELRYGRTVPTAINIGFNRAWSAIRDSNISTLITCGVLFWFADTLGASIVKGFAITLAIGVLISMFSAITVTKTILQLLGMGILGKKPMIFTPFSPKSINQKNNKE
ncbi:MAG: protein translocase subunit SecD, partial [Nitrososphaerales archaeon]|nr:protein translocase subunit SecD [Nitrososphaerales archaeon]